MSEDSPPRKSVSISVNIPDEVFQVLAEKHKEVISAAGKFCELWAKDWREKAFRLEKKMQSTIGDPVQEQRACRVCGCTDDRACPGGCYWVEDDLCSRCAAMGKRESFITKVQAFISLFVEDFAAEVSLKIDGDDLEDTKAKVTITTPDRRTWTISLAPPGDGTSELIILLEDEMGMPANQGSLFAALWVQAYLRLNEAKEKREELRAENEQMREALRAIAGLEDVPVNIDCRLNRCSTVEAIKDIARNALESPK